MGKLEVINHPLIQHKLSILRRTDTSTKAFRELVDEIAMLMGNMKYFVIFRLKTLKSKHLSQKQFKNNWLVKNWQLFQSCVQVSGWSMGY